MHVSARIHPALAPWIIFSSFLRKLYIQRGLIRNFVIRDLRARYIGSFMGFFWSIIHPIVLLVSYTFVFSIVFNMRPKPDTGTTSFPLFLFCSILPWLFFQEALQRSSTVVIDNTNLVTKTIFPTEILPLTVLLSSMVNHLIGFAILLVILLALGKVSFLILLVPIYFFLLMLFTLGLSWLLAALNVFIRDVSQIISVILIFWFWFTPIFYTPDLIEEAVNRHPYIGQLLFLSKWNPLAQVVIAYRQCLLAQEVPSLKVLLGLSAASIGVFILGGMFFRHIKREFVDVL
jgi:lipopolysaccharide transport system permease protein